MNDVKILEMYRFLTKCYQAKNDGDKATFYFEKFEQLNEQITKNSLVNNRKMEYEFTQSNVRQQLKVNQLREKQKRIQLERLLESERYKAIIMWMILSISVIGVIIVIYWISKRHKIEKVLAAKNLENKNLQLKHKQEILTQLALETSRKKALSKELISQVKKLNSPHSEKSQSLIQYIRTELGISPASVNLDHEVHHLTDSFFQKLDETFPNLTKKERELCVMIKLNLSNKEIAVIRGISPSSVKVTKNRLKKKLGIDKDESLTATISLIKDLHE